MIEPASVVAWVMVVGLAVTGPLAAIHGVPGSLHGGAVFWLVLSGAGNVGGLVLAYHAMRIGQVALVAPLVSTEGAIAALIAVAAGETLAPGVGGTLVLIAIGICLAAVPSDPRIAARLHAKEKPSAWKEQNAASSHPACR